MDMDTNNNKYQPGYYFSNKIQGLVAGLNVYGQGWLEHNGKEFGSFDLEKRVLDFYGHPQSPIHIDEALTVDQSLDMVMYLSEGFAKTELDAQYRDDYKEWVFERDFPKDLLLDVDFRIEKIQTKNGPAEKVIMHMKDSGAQVSLTHYKNADLSPELSIEEPGDGGYYMSKGIMKIGKEEEEEFGKALKYLHFLPKEVVGNATAEWIQAVWNRSEEIKSKFKESGYAEPIDLDVDLGGFESTMTMDAVPFEDAEDTLTPSEIMGYTSSGAIDSSMMRSRENLYEFAIQLVNSENRAYNLRDFFMEELYPYIDKLYSEYGYETLPQEVKDRFDKFSVEHAEVYGFHPYNAELNECLRLALSQDGELETQYKKLWDLLEESRTYVLKVKAGGSPTQELINLRMGSVEAQMHEIEGRFSMFPEDQRPIFCSRATIDDHVQAMLDTRYKNSNLYKEQLMEPSDDNFFVHNDMEINARVDTLLITTPALEEELYERSGLHEQTGRSYADIIASGETLEIWAYSYFRDDSVKMEVIDESARGSQVILSQAEQAYINSRVENCLGTSIEDHIAKDIGKQLLKPEKVHGAQILGDGRLVSVTPEFSTAQLYEALQRSNGYMVFKVKSFDEFKREGYHRNVEVVMSRDGDVRLRIPGGPDGRCAEVPLTNDEKQTVMDHFVNEYGMSPNDYINNHGADKKNRKRLDQPGME